MKEILCEKDGLYDLYSRKEKKMKVVKNTIVEEDKKSVPEEQTGPTPTHCHEVPRNNSSSDYVPVGDYSWVDGVLQPRRGWRGVLAGVR